MFPQTLLTRLLLLLAATLYAFGQQTGEALPKWTPGNLDIHQIQTGRGNSALLVFPDGTTMMVDAGAVPERKGPELGPARPNGSRSPGEWIARYIRQFSPKPELDYAGITHHHDDHNGGLAAVKKEVPIHLELNRETFVPGRNDQIVAKTPGFEVRNIAANGFVWTGEGTGTKLAFPNDWATLPPAERPTENHLSIAMRIRYGGFTYYTGGDLPGVVLDNLPAWLDMDSALTTRK